MGQLWNRRGLMITQCLSLCTPQGNTQGLSSDIDMKLMRLPSDAKIFGGFMVVVVVGQSLSLKRKETRQIPHKGDGLAPECCRGIDKEISLLAA